jgi:acetyl esterase/lipase
VCQDSKQRGLHIRGQLLRIPVVCPSEQHCSELGLRSIFDLKDPAILTPESMKQFLRWYNPADASHVTVSPLLAPSFDELPPTFFQICGKDPLRDEGLAYADALESAGYADPPYPYSLKSLCIR